MKKSLFYVDAFTDRAFSGNPAAVCLLESAAEEQWMQQVACELNVSETAFLYPQENGFSLRWFTPRMEVELCGHATLASALVLWETAVMARDNRIRFHTRSGQLLARLQGEWIALDFPASHPEPATLPREYVTALGVTPLYTCKIGPRYIVEVATEEQVRGAKPDFPALRRLPGRGVAITSAGSAGYDFVSRYFAPWVGVDEDPVTGSIHCALAVMWGDRLGRKELRAFQASARGGTLQLILEGNRISLSGQAVMVFAGELRV